MTNEKNNLFEENLNNSRISLKKSQFYGGKGGEYHDDWDLIKTKFSDHLIKKVKVKEFEVFYRHNSLNFINFTYQITTDRGVFELKGNEFGTNYKDFELENFNHCLADDEIIEEFAINDYLWSDKIINGLQIITSKNTFSFGPQGCKKFSTNGENLIIYGIHGLFVGGLGFYYSDNNSNEIKDENEEVNDEKSESIDQWWLSENFTVEEKEEWLNLGFQDTDVQNAKIWRNLFGFEETKKWLNSGIDVSKYQQAYYWKQNNQWSVQSEPTPKNKEELESLKEKGIEVSNWINFFHPQNDVCLFDENSIGKKRSEVEDLYFPNNNLIGHLDLSDFVNLVTLNISNNKLKSLNLDSCINLERLHVGDNFYLTNPSLIQFKNLTKLKYLDLNNSPSISTGLEYLPNSLETFSCVLTKLFEKLMLYNYNLLNWQSYNPELMRKAGRDLSELIDYKNNKLIAIITTPKFLNEEESNKVKLNTNNQLSNLDYSDFIIRDNYPFKWENKLKVANQSLPLRLYNLSSDQVENTDNLNINNYLILSYCWGTDWENTPQSYGQTYSTDLTKLGRKALNKVKAFYQNHKERNIPPHIWIDNFCINQANNEEKGHEVKRQKQYYSQSSATLINIDAEIGKTIDKNDDISLAKHLIKLVANSVWFTRAWTFQEGLLSQQTIFMFDDYLVDGRLLSQYWGSFQYNNSGVIELRKSNLITYITPLGWSYCSQEHINLKLGEALHAISKRSQTVPIDGIYSILGLLPYGDKVKTKYKKDSNYSITELEEALEEIKKVALKSDNYIDLLSWIGPRNNKLLPSINKNGTTNFKEILTHLSFENIKQSIIEISDQFIKLKKVESLLVSNLWKTNEYVSIISVQSSEKEETVNLYHSNDLIVEKGDSLVFFSIENDSEKIALLVPNNVKHSLYLCKYNSFIELNFSSEVLIDIKERKVSSYSIFFCDNCGKEITKEKVHFSDREKDLDLCSRDCMNSWKEENVLTVDNISEVSIENSINEEFSEIIEEIPFILTINH